MVVWFTPLAFTRLNSVASERFRGYGGFAGCGGAALWRASELPAGFNYAGIAVLDWIAVDARRQARRHPPM